MNGFSPSPRGAVTIWWLVLCCGMALVTVTSGQPWEFVGGLLMIAGGINLGAAAERTRATPEGPHNPGQGDGG